MGLRNSNTNNRSTNQTNTRQADGFLNIAVKTSAGEKQIKATIPLYAGNHVHEQLMQAAEADPERQFQLVGSVNIVDPEPDDIQFI